MNPSARPGPPSAQPTPAIAPPRRIPPGWLLATGLVGVALVVAGIAAARSSPLPKDFDSIRALLNARQFAAAEAALVGRLGRTDDPVAWVMLGGVRAMAGRDAEAEAAYRHVPGPGAAWTQAQTQLAEIALRRRDLAGAEATFRAVAEADPTAVDARRRLAYLYTLTAP